MDAELLDRLRAAARHWLGAGRPDHAEPALRDVLAADPHDAFALSALAELLLERNDLAEAAEVARSAVAAHPDDPICHASLARARLGTKDPRGAVAAASAAVRLAPGSPYCLGLLAMTLFSAGAVADARAAAEACLRVQPADQNALAIVALSCLARADHAGAERAARALLQSGPVEGFCLTMAGRVFRQIGLRAEGMRLLRTLVGQQPNNPRAHEALGLAYWNRGDAPAARRHFREAVRIDPRLDHVRQILRLHSKTRPQDMPEGWVLTRFVDRYDAHGWRHRTVVEQRQRPAPLPPE